MRENL